ncbi:carboxymuconolactone decarboxylase family protein [Pseudomonas putida]|jgi:alkylhydroperoxidase/carboxymuconolactone decarboxylase family protein YurZ|uniref:carboxymuconolactone decarboxylase family protein n=1 Tax=Pseudomonas TaxID=286 RepID=UPI00062B0900|nr:carboxymuconolactone decarboxylase family protein [Pseudomonas putida]KKX69633.1 carboxymuconolactone decarboxylase [Pseudomonas putida]
MNSTQPSNRCHVRLGALGFVILVSFAWAQISSANTSHEPEKQLVSEQTLTAKQQVIAPIGASMAVGDMSRLHDALNRGLDAGLTISESKEILVQLYAYAGFPRSLNALSLLMKVLEDRAVRGIHDAPGRDPGPVPSGRALLDLGTDNQTRLLGAPVSGPLFEFAPAIDQFLKGHLFGDIFARDNLEWTDRELATVGAIAAMPGLEPQLESHLKISMNVGLTVQQLHQVASELKTAGEPDGAERILVALEKISGRARYQAGTD